MAGVFQAGASHDGSLGGAYRDGVLGAMLQNGSFRDGSLGRAMYQPGAFHDGALGLNKYMAMSRMGSRIVPTRRPGSAAPRQHLRGLGGGCGCSGMGDDTVVAPADTPFYKKPAVIGAAAVALGVVLYAVSKR